MGAHKESNIQNTLDLLDKKDNTNQISLFLELEGSLNFQNICVPLSIFNNDSLSGLECATKYLKENLNFRIKDISILLNRNQKTIWGAYNDSKNKMNVSFEINHKESIPIPTLIFVDRSLSFLESLIMYLHEEMNMRYCKIACLTGKDDRTIWTVHNRAKKKNKLKFFENGA